MVIEPAAPLIDHHHFLLNSQRIRVILMRGVNVRNLLIAIRNLRVVRPIDLQQILDAHPVGIHGINELHLANLLERHPPHASHLHPAHI